MSNLLKKDKGFTLIEIVLVLAIAGLLLVVVFLAVSGAQKSRRDSQRKNDISRVAAALESSASNTNGVYPAAGTGAVGANVWGNFVTSSFITGGNFNVPGTSSPYTFDTVDSGGTIVPAQDHVNYTISGTVYKVCIGLEQGVSCRSNN